MIKSFSLSVMWSSPCPSSMYPTSPVLYQPSASTASAVASDHIVSVAYMQRTVNSLGLFKYSFMILPPLNMITPTSLGPRVLCVTGSATRMSKIGVGSPADVGCG